MNTKEVKMNIVLCQYLKSSDNMYDQYVFFLPSTIFSFDVLIFVSQKNLWKKSSTLVLSNKG